MKKRLKIFQFHPPPCPPHESCLAILVLLLLSVVISCSKLEKEVCQRCHHHPSAITTSEGDEEDTAILPRTHRPYLSLLSQEPCLVRECNTNSKDSSLRSSFWNPHDDDGDEEDRMLHISILIPPPWRRSRTHFNSINDGTVDILPEEYIILASKLLLLRDDIIVTIHYYKFETQDDFIPSDSKDDDPSSHNRNDEDDLWKERIFKSMPCEDDWRFIMRRNKSRLRARAVFVLPPVSPKDESAILTTELHAATHHFFGSSPTSTMPHVVLTDANHLGALWVAEAYGIPKVTWISSTCKTSTAPLDSLYYFWTTLRRRQWHGILQWLRDCYTDMVMIRLWSPIRLVNRQRRRLQVTSQRHHLSLIRMPSELVTRAHLVLVNSFPAMMVDETTTSTRLLSLPKNAIWMGPLLPECVECECEEESGSQNDRVLPVLMDAGVSIDDATSNAGESAAIDKEDNDDDDDDKRDPIVMVVLPTDLMDVTRVRSLVRGLSMAKRGAQNHQDLCMDDNYPNDYGDDDVYAPSSRSRLDCANADDMAEWKVVWLTEEEEGSGTIHPFDVLPNEFEFEPYSSQWKQVTEKKPIMVVSYCGPESYGLLSTGAPMLCLRRDDATFSSSRERLDFIAAQKRMAYLSGGEVLLRHNDDSKGIANAVIRILQDRMPKEVHDKRLEGIDWYRADRAAEYIGRIAEASKYSRDKTGTELQPSETVDLLHGGFYDSTAQTDPYFYLTGDESGYWEPFLVGVAEIVAWTILFLFALSCCMLPQMPSWRRAFRHHFRYSDVILETLNTTYHHFLLWVDDQDSFHSSVERRLRPLFAQTEGGPQSLGTGQEQNPPKKGANHHQSNQTRRRRQVKRRKVA